MRTPVRCAYCGVVYDMAAVHVVARYADCSEWVTECCARRVDDREWVGFPAFTRLDAFGPR